MHRIKSLFILFVVILFSFSALSAQHKVAIAERYIHNHIEAFDLETSDIENIKLNDFYKTKHNGVTHIYFKQVHAGIEIYNAILNINVNTKNEVFFTGNRFIGRIREKVNTTKPNFSPELAIEYAAMYLDVLEDLDKLVEFESISDIEFIFSGSGISSENIPAKLIYQEKGDEIRLCWDVLIHMKSSPDVWSMRIDAVTGALVDKNNYNIYCFGVEERHLHENTESIGGLSTVSIPLADSFEAGMVDASYRVFAIPAENPSDGEHIMTNDAPIDGPSPFGWHDIDGFEGSEFTITRGNNVYAYLDEDGNNSPDDFNVDGGDELIFDFPFDDMKEPFEMKEAGLINMFYMANYMHDFAYIYGFDEEAGNFQENNYGNGGLESDGVRAEGNDGDDVDNAMFNVSPDGVNGRLTMFLWNSRGRGKLRVEEPADIAGHIFATGDAEGPDGFGAAITVIPVTGEMAVVDSGGDEPDLGCTVVLNASEINGKIAVIRRGECDFSLKAYHAQEAGAIGVIICNNAEDLISMGSGDMGSEVIIPVVFIRNYSCDTILDIIDDGVVSIVENPINPPLQKSGMFSNGVIAHEYAHGISSRLTGGPSESNCLFNDEQMGEGWSDFFLLTTTVKITDVGEDPRGVGSYLVDDSRGIRRFPYSTDMNVNPQTMKDILNTSTDHTLGEVWADVLWDLYWALVDRLGYNEDLSDKKSGNATALQLIIDGMKLQPCRPGFMDGRDAILAADLENNNGENECLIWNIFAGRGMGLDADQGSTSTREDNVEAFNVPTPCESSAVEEILDENTNFTVFPNPNNGQFSIEIESKIKSNAFLNLVSGDGKFIYRQSLTIEKNVNHFRIGPLKLPSGIYLVWIQGPGINMYQKIMVE